MHREIISERELIHYKGLGLYHSMEAGTGPVLLRTHWLLPC